MLASEFKQFLNIKFDFVTSALLLFLEESIVLYFIDSSYVINWLFKFGKLKRSYCVGDLVSGMMMTTDMLLKCYAISNTFLLLPQLYACKFLPSKIDKKLLNQ